MSATAAPDQVSEESLTFEMPAVQIGDDICVYEHGDRGTKPSYGKVIGVSTRNISAVIFTPAFHGGHVKPDLLHCSDPWVQERPERKMHGTWDFAGATKRLRDLVAQLDRYGDRLVSLEAAATEPKKK